MLRTDFFRLKAIKCDVDGVIRSRGLGEMGQVQKFIDSECLRLSNEKAPFAEHNLIASSEVHTKIGSGQLEYRTPYARRLYYHDEYNFSKEKNPDAGAYWFERMKQQHKNEILKGAKKIADGGSS